MGYLLPGARLGEYVGEAVMACGLVVEQRRHHQITGEPMKFLTLADWPGIVKTELFAKTNKNYELATVRYPVQEVTATVEPFENGRGFSLRVLRAGTQVNCQRHRKIQRAKDADRLKPNGNAASVLPPCKRSTRTKPAAGVEAGAMGRQSWKSLADDWRHLQLF